MVSPLAGGNQNVFFGAFASNSVSPYDFNVEANLADYTNISMDILVAPGTPLSGNGNYGTIGVGIINTDAEPCYLQLGSATIPASASSAWYHIVVPINQAALDGNVDVPGISLDINSFGGYPLFTFTNWLDNISLNASTDPPPPPGTNATAFIGIDAATNRSAISPMIYGVAFTYQSIRGIERSGESFRWKRGIDLQLGDQHPRQGKRLLF